MMKKIYDAVKRRNEEYERCVRHCRRWCCCCCYLLVARWAQHSLQWPLSLFSCSQ